MPKYEITICPEYPYVSGLAVIEAPNKETAIEIADGMGLSDTHLEGSDVLDELQYDRLEAPVIHEIGDGAEVTYDAATGRIHQYDDGDLIPKEALCLPPFLRDIVHRFPGFLDDSEVNGSDLVQYIQERIAGYQPSQAKTG